MFKPTVDEKLKEFVECYYGEPAPTPESDRFPDWQNTFGFAQAIVLFTEERVLEELKDQSEHWSMEYARRHDVGCPKDKLQLRAFFLRFVIDQRLAAIVKTGKEKDGKD